MIRWVQHCFLARELIRRDFQSRYAGSALGFLWSFFQPAAMLALFTFAFSYVMRVPLDGYQTNSFAVFLFAGFLPYMAVQDGVQRAATSITDNSVLIQRLSLPPELLVGTVVVNAVLHELIALSVFSLVLGWLGLLKPLQLLLLIPAMVLQILLSLGLGLGLAAIQVYFRDVGQLLSIVFMAWFYGTPIVYPPSMLPPEAWRWLRLNPLSVLVGIYRQALGIGPPVDLASWVSLTAFSGVAFVCGWLLFRRLRGDFADAV